MEIKIYRIHMNWRVIIHIRKVIYRVSLLRTPSLQFYLKWFNSEEFILLFFPFTYLLDRLLNQKQVHCTFGPRLSSQKSMSLRHCSLGAWGMSTEQTCHQPPTETANQPFGFTSSKSQWNVCHDFRPQRDLVCLDS